MVYKHLIEFCLGIKTKQKEDCELIETGIDIQENLIFHAEKMYL